MVSLYLLPSILTHSIFTNVLCPLNSLNMSSCREAAFAKNKAKLESERTVGLLSLPLSHWIFPLLTTTLFALLITLCTQVVSKMVGA
jgi:hypothetical protein